MLNALTNCLDATHRTVLVTGATGFLGAAIVQQCQAAGFRVRTTGRVATGGDLANYIRADLLDPNCHDRLLAGVHHVVHSAGLAHQFGRAAISKERFLAVNSEMTRQLATAAVRHHVGHFVLISSVSVYGTSNSGDPVTESTPCHPEGPYAESKYQAEQHAISVAVKSGMLLTILRMATVYGEGDPGNLTRLMGAVDRKRFVWVGSGDNRKSLVYRDDAARACMLVLTATPASPLAPVRIFNVSAPAVTMREIVEELARLLGRKLPALRLPAAPCLGLLAIAARLSLNRGRLATPYRTLRKWLADDVYDATKFATEFGYRPETPLSTGLARQVEWYRTACSLSRRRG